MKSSKPGLALALSLMAAAGAGLAADRDPAAKAPAMEVQLSVADMLERISRYQQVPGARAETWHAGLRLMNGSAAQLELALLEIYGPEPVADVKSGLARVEDLRAQSTHWPAEVARLLELITFHADERLRQTSYCEALVLRLRQERDAHDQALEKLRALREIERQLETESEEPETRADDIPPGGRR
ncbi:MAG: hypothetical protein ACNA7J_02000 [Wenzhouxiangella sp.]